MKFLISFLLFFTGIVLGLAAAGAGLVLAVSGAAQGWRAAGISPGFWERDDVGRDHSFAGFGGELGVSLSPEFYI